MKEKTAKEEGASGALPVPITAKKRRNRGKKRPQQNAAKSIVDEAQANPPSNAAKKRKKRSTKRRRMGTNIGMITDAHGDMQSAGDGSESVEELVGFVFKERLLLAGASSGLVFDSERDTGGNLIVVGRVIADGQRHPWDAASLASGSTPIELHLGSQKLQEDPSRSRSRRCAKPFGSFFPNAIRIPGALDGLQGPISILLFYQYAEPLWSDIQKVEAMHYMQKLGIKYNLGGRLRISREGFNATLSGTRTSLDAFCDRLRRWRPQNFSATDFKFLNNLPVDKAFKELCLFPVQEIVRYGVSPDLADRIAHLKGEHLAASDYHKKMSEPDTVIIDVRNTYESDVGRFQPPDGGAEFIDPRMRRSHEFQQFLVDPSTKEKLRGKQILMYCTGGVRCERASSLLRYELGDSVKGVFQLQGGIEKYMQEFNGQGYWIGKNFTFDKRNANSAGEMFEDPYAQRNAAHVTSAKCATCAIPCDQYLGHRKCTDCAVPVIVCDDCRSSRKDKAEGARCTLCRIEFHYLAKTDGAIANALAQELADITD